MAYPASFDTFNGTTATGTSLLSSPDHAADHRALGSAAGSLQGVVGTTSGTNVLKSFAAGNFPVRVNASNVLQHIVTNGTIGTSLIGSSTITTGTLNGTPVIGTPSITGGTITSALLGTNTITGGTINNPIMKAPTEAWVTDSDGATVTFDLSAGNKHRVTLGGNRTLALSNPIADSTFIIKLTQDGTGTRTVTWFSTLQWAGGSAPTLTVTGGKSDTFGFIRVGAGTYDAFVVGQNI